MQAGKISLSELQLIIRDSLYLALPDFYWVIAEIAELKQNYSGHCYLELIEKQDEESSIKARIRAVIWSSRYGFIKSFFENSTGESLREGFKVLVKVRVEYHELYGLSLVITDIDPSYTIGEMAVKRQMIIKRLEEEGVFSMNKELDIPIVPQRIAVISSGRAAGYTDFVNHLDENRYQYKFYTALFESVMQGTETEQSIVSSLDRIANNADLFDLVIIIRGGGSQTDLSWFDNYKIAYHITQFPLPVITGIGHEKDLSVADLVACRSLKTPTAVADFLIETVAETENHLIEISGEIKDLVLEVIEENMERLEKAKNILLPLTKILISDIRKSLSDKVMELSGKGREKTFKATLEISNLRSQLVSATEFFTSGRSKTISGYKEELLYLTHNRLRLNSSRIDSMNNMLESLNPDNVLRRGYTITSMNGRIVKSIRELDEDKIINTRFSDGRITSRITGKTEKKK